MGDIVYEPAVPRARAESAARTSATHGSTSRMMTGNHSWPVTQMKIASNQTQKRTHHAKRDQEWRNTTTTNTDYIMRIGQDYRMIGLFIFFFNRVSIPRSWSLNQKIQIKRILPVW